MAVQIRLKDIWASIGGITDTGLGKYVLGWVSEIPTFQNFNFVLNALDSNMLVVAESGHFDWELGISYKKLTKVKGSDGLLYTSLADGNLDEDPVLDVINNFWYKGDTTGTTNTFKDRGILIDDINTRTEFAWNGNDMTIRGQNNLIALYNTSALNKNLLLGNVAGELIVHDAGLTNENPDATDLRPSQNASSYKIYHEGFKPVQTDVAGTIPDANSDGNYYGRNNANWLNLNTYFQRKVEDVLSLDLSGDLTGNRVPSINFHATDTGNEVVIERIGGVNGALNIKNTGTGNINYHLNGLSLVSMYSIGGKGVVKSDYGDFYGSDVNNSGVVCSNIGNTTNVPLTLDSPEGLRLTSNGSYGSNDIPFLFSNDVGLFFLGLSTENTSYQGRGAIISDFPYRTSVGFSCKAGADANSNSSQRVFNIEYDEGTPGLAYLWVDEFDFGIIQTTPRSDYRTKKNVTSCDYGLDDIMKLKPISFDYDTEIFDKTFDKDGNETTIHPYSGHHHNFIAHELQKIIPEAVTGTKDEVGEDGKPIYQTVDNREMSAVLVQAMQDLKVIVDSQLLRIEALEKEMVIVKEEVSPLSNSFGL